MKSAATLLAGLCLAMLAAPAPAQPIDPKVQARIDRLLKRTPLIDGHNDLPEQLQEDYGYSVEGLESGTASRRPQPLMTDMERLRAGRVGGQFWSVWIPGTLTGDEAIRRTIEQIDIVRRLVKAYPHRLEPASSADDLVRIHKRVRIGSLIGIEGGRAIGGSLAALRLFHSLGARAMTLTHEETTEWADSGTDNPKHDGLSRFGIEVVHEMNRLGMLVDLSHVSPATMRDAIAASRAPVVFTHSNARGLMDHPRNVPDDVLRLIAEKGGVVMVTFVPRFLSMAAWERFAAMRAEEARLKAMIPQSSERVKAELAKWEAAHPSPPVTVSEVADHIEHIVRVAGHDHVGIGGDFDGISLTVEGLDGVEDYPNLFAELIRRGWSDQNLAKLAGGNILRVLRRAEAVAAEMEDQEPSLAKLKPAE